MTLKTHKGTLDFQRGEQQEGIQVSLPRELTKEHLKNFQKFRNFYYKIHAPQKRNPINQYLPISMNLSPLFLPSKDKEIGPSY